MMHLETEATQFLRRAASAAREASLLRALLPASDRNGAVCVMAASLRVHAADILAANSADLAACRGTAAVGDRLTVTEARIDAMGKGLEEIAQLPDPLGRTLADW